MRITLIVAVCCVLKVNCLLFPVVFPDRVYNYTPPEDEVTFHLFHRSNLSVDQQIFIGDVDSIAESKFDPGLPTKILIHGWTHSKDVPWLAEMREVMADTGLWNVLIVDWSVLAHVIYVEARVHTPVVGKQLKNFILFLAKQEKVPLSSVHLIGHSMGAQIAARAAHLIRVETGHKIGRVTGLDPAAPLYEWPHIESLDDVLDPTDAQFVDVIHTNGRHLGMMTPAGHVDYYPNGGETQDGCRLWACSHLRACEFWTASVLKPDLFRAFSYKAWDRFLQGKTDHLDAYPMGIAAGPDMPFGVYFVERTDEWRRYSTSKTTMVDSRMFIWAK